MNEHIEPFSYAEALMKALPKGVLLSTEKKGAMNTMVIGWGALGTNWGKRTRSKGKYLHPASKTLLTFIIIS